MSICLTRLRVFGPHSMTVRHSMSGEIAKKPKHINRRIFEAVTAPIYPEMFDKPHITISGCDVLRAEQKVVEEEENLYAQFLLRRTREMFETNEMVMIFFKMTMPYHEEREQILNFRRNKFTLENRFPNEIVREYVLSSKYQNIEPLLPHIFDPNVYVYSKEERVKELVAMLKKVPDYILIGGIVNDHILRRADIERYAKMPEKEQQLGETLSLLGYGAQQVHVKLQSHQQKLAGLLSQHIKDRSGDSPES